MGAVISVSFSASSADPEGLAAAAGAGDAGAAAGGAAGECPFECPLREMNSSTSPYLIDSSRTSVVTFAQSTIALSSLMSGGLSGMVTLSLGEADPQGACGHRLGAR